MVWRYFIVFILYSFEGGGGGALIGCSVTEIVI